MAPNQTKQNDKFFQETVRKNDDPFYGLQNSIFLSPFTAQPEPPTIKTIPAGVYKPMSDMFRGIYLDPCPVQTDKLYRIPGGVAEDVINDINTFMSADTQAKYARYGFMHRRGILVHGKPGSGKTSVFNQIAEDFVKNGGVVIRNVDGFNADFIGMVLEGIRNGEPNRPLLVLFEELDDLVDNFGDYNLTQLLDGAKSIDKVVYLLSTNYFERLPKKLVARQTRIARCIQMDGPPRKVREEYLRNVIKPEDAALFDMEKLLPLTDGMVLDNLKDIVLGVVCYGQTIEQACNKVREMALAAGKEPKDVDPDADDT